MRKTVGVGALVVGVLLADAGSSRANVVRIDRSEGWGPMFEAAGKVRHPRRVFMMLRSRPPRDWPVKWATVCFNWSKQEREHGKFTLRTSVWGPVRKRIGIAYWRPDRCRVRVTVGNFLFDGAGTTLLLKARV